MRRDDSTIVRGSIWNLVAGEARALRIVGLARYRLGDWGGSIEALEKAIGAQKVGGTALDWLLSSPSRPGRTG